MRANESLPLTSQADAAFLVHVAKLGITDEMGKGQFLRTLEIIRHAVLHPKKAVLEAASEMIVEE